jgi:hypothetical protein
LLWALVIEGITEVAIAVAGGGLTIPPAGVLAALVLWWDRPRVRESGRLVAWIWAALQIGVWAFGILLLRWTELSANWYD